MLKYDFKMYRDASLGPMMEVWVFESAEWG